MSGIIGPLTSGRIAIALGTIGVGAIVGGFVADQTDRDVAKGALIGGASALAGLALVHGGAAAWQRFTAARAGAATGATQLGSTIPRFGTPPLTLPRASVTLSTLAPSSPPSSAPRAWGTLARSLFGVPSAVATLRPLTVAVPAAAATPLLPSAASGSTFLSTLARFA